MSSSTSRCGSARRWHTEERAPERKLRWGKPSCEGCCGRSACRFRHLPPPAARPTPALRGTMFCILGHLRLYDQQGYALPLTQVPANAVTPNTRAGTSGSAGGVGTSSSTTASSSTSSTSSSTSGGGGPLSSVPTVSGMPTTMTFDDPSLYVEVTLQFVDTCGDRPGGCFSIHRPSSPLPGGTSGNYWMATPPVADQQTAGTWPFQVGFEYTTSANDTFTVDFVAWSNCGDPNADPIQALEDGASVAIGPETSIAVQVNVPVESGGGSGLGGSCVSPTVTDTLRSGCCSTGICPNSCSDGTDGWYEVGSSVYGPCVATDSSCMQGAATAALQACGYP